MRRRLILAAMVAAALFGGGSVTRAMTDGPSAGWFFTPVDDRTQPAAAIGGSSLGAVSFDLRDASGAPFAASPFAFDVVSPVGSLYASGYSASLTVPHLLSGGIIARDGPFYTVRDLEIVDKLTPDIAVNFGFDLNRGSGFDVTDVRSAPANQGLFFSLSDFEAPYAMSGDNAVDTGARFELGDGLSVSFGQSLLDSRPGGFSRSWAQSEPAGVAFDQREAATSLAGADWQFAPWGGVGLEATHSTDRVGLLGGSPVDSLSLAKSATTTLGATGRFAFGGGWITSFSYNEAVTQLDLRPAGGVLAAEALHSRSYGLSVARHGLFGGDDSLGIAVSRPLEIAPGGVDLGGAATADPFDGFLSSTTHPIMSGESSETDLQLGYVTTFMDGALALQANAGYQMNVAGQSGNNGVTVLSRAKINF